GCSSEIGRSKLPGSSACPKPEGRLRQGFFSGDPSAEMVERRCTVAPPSPPTHPAPEAVFVTAFACFVSDEDLGQGFQRKPTA
ncbi:hypothetical protein BHE74_00046855, partial [Ensete ventricosum]